MRLGSSCGNGVGEFGEPPLAQAKLGTAIIARQTIVVRAAIPNPWRMIRLAAPLEESGHNVKRVMTRS
jgi:hypothetical protein